MRNESYPTIREKMRRNGVFWWQVADKIGVSEATIYRILRRPLDAETAQKMDDALNSIIKERG